MLQTGPGQAASNADWLWKIAFLDGDRIGV